MNIIERYISAYVVHCLFPQETGSEGHLNYVYEVLRETRSTPRNALLRQVIDFTRQSDPADPSTQESVRQYVLSRLLAPKVEVNPAPEYVAKYAKDTEATAFIIMKGKHPVAFAGCLNESFEECKKEIESQFPDIVFVEIER